jgi:type IV pilus assembly protein PilB
MSRIGELLVREKVLSLQQLQQAQDEAKRTGKRLGATLAKMGMVPDNVLTQMVARQYSLPAINLAEIEIDPNVLKLIPKDICEKHQVIPVRRQGPTLIVAMADPSNIYAIDELKFLTQYNIDPVVASDAAIETALARYYDKGPDLDAMIGDIDVENVDFAAVRRRGQRRRPREPGRRGAGGQAV